jgi:hypothetical protein
VTKVRTAPAPILPGEPDGRISGILIVLSIPKNYNLMLYLVHAQLMFVIPALSAARAIGTA